MQKELRPKGAGKGKTGGNKTEDGRDRKRTEDVPGGKKRPSMPDWKFKALREIKAREKNGVKACRYWNSSIGCAAEGTCPFAHNICRLCGKDNKCCAFQVGNGGARRGSLPATVSQGEDSRLADNAKEPPSMTVVPLFITAAGCLLLFFFSDNLFQLASNFAELYASNE